MKIETVNVYLVRAGMLHPVIVEVLTDEGITGIGEAGIAYGVGGTAAAGMVKDLAERMIVGRDPRQIEMLWAEMYDHSFWAKGGGPIVFAAISGIEQALWDIKGKQFGVPVYELLGGRMRDRVRVYANGWYGKAGKPDEFATAVERPLRDGYDAVKFYPLANFGPNGLRHVSNRTIDREAENLAVERVRAVRNAVGADVEIMLDLSAGLTTDVALRFCRRVEEFDIAWIEEPVDPFDKAAMTRLANHVQVPLAAGERAYSRHGFRPLLETQSLGVLQPDVGTAGGILEAKKIAAMAEAWGVRLAPHNCGSGLLTAASLQVSACTANFMTQEIYPYFHERPGYVQVLEDPPEERIHNGSLDLPERPGLGCTLAAERVRPFLFASCSAAR